MKMIDEQLLQTCRAAFAVTAPDWALIAIASGLLLGWLALAFGVALLVAAAVRLREQDAPKPPAAPVPATTVSRARRLRCAPGHPCRLHDATICVASPCCDRHCPTAEAPGQVWDVTA